jgi:2-hydroxy-4-carboxymuconate semialdehyde hemiacetal dehydrogenase
MTAPFGLCLAGTGGIASQHMKAFAALGGVTPRWVVSRTADGAAQFAQSWNFPNSGVDLTGALADPAVNLVVIASPSDLHASQALQSLEAGKHVIVEIPTATNLADARRLAAAVKAANRRVLVCHSMRSYPGIREVRRRVQSGALHLSHIAGYFTIPRRRNQSWARQRNWIDNLLWHHACHQVDAAMWVLGAATAWRISGRLGKPHPRFGMATDVAIHFEAGGGTLVSQALSYNSEQFCWELRFLGAEESLTWRNGRLLNEKDEDVVPESSWLDMTLQNSEMLHAIVSGEPGAFDIECVLPCMEVLHEAETSAHAD